MGVHPISRNANTITLQLYSYFRLALLPWKFPFISVTTEQIAELRQRRAQGILIKTLMADYRLSKASVYRYLGQTEHSGRPWL